jgi:hypothetical protein
MASKPSSTQPLVSPTPSASPGANTTTPASSSKNAASSSSSSIDLSNLCHLTISQLQADGNKLTAPCFLCGLLVHYHVTSASSSSHSPSSSKSLDKTVKADMPLWKTDFKVCAPFFKRIEQVFNIHSIHDDALRRKYLYVTLSDLDAFDVQYVLTTSFNHLCHGMMSNLLSLSGLNNSIMLLVFNVISTTFVMSRKTLFSRFLIDSSTTAPTSAMMLMHK